MSVAAVLPSLTGMVQEAHRQAEAEVANRVARGLSPEPESDGWDYGSHPEIYRDSWDRTRPAFWERRAALAEKAKARVVIDEHHRCMARMLATAAARNTVPLVLGLPLAIIAGVYAGAMLVRALGY